MRDMKKKIFYTIISILTGMIFYGCGDFLSEYSQDMVVPKTISDLDEVLIGEVYIKSHEVKYGMSAGICGFFNMLDDDINTVGTNQPGKTGSDYYVYSVKGMFGYYAWQQDVRKNYTGSNITDDNTTWDDLYHRINVVNIILDEIEQLPHTTDQDHADYLRVKGEAHFLRAQFYFILANLYGDSYAPSTCSSKLCVPLKLSAEVEYDKDKDTQFERASVKVVYDQIVSDLVKAEKLLAESPQNEKRRLHRATQEAAALLLSRVYLYMQDWGNAEQKAKIVMDSPNFNLSSLSTLTNGEAFLTENNPEIIFSQGANYIATSSNSWSVYAVPSDYCVTRELYNLYTEKDARKACFFERNSQTDSIALSRKYQRELSLNHISDALALRISEALLNYAEACAMQSGKEVEANNTLNRLRMQRIQEYNNQTYTGEELVKQIREERRKELCFEGKRWFDLRRYAVCEQYPYSRNILHVFQIYSDNAYFSGTLQYLLPAGDPAYTFGIPRKVLEFDKVPMKDNPREARPALEQLPKPEP